MMNARQMCEVMNKRLDLITTYCKKKSWDDQKITPEQRKEIRATYEWRHIILKVMEGY